MLTNQQVMALMFLLCVFFGMGRKESCKTVVRNDIEAIHMENKCSREDYYYYYLY